MSDIQAKNHSYIFLICLITSIVLLAVGFLFPWPPSGMIDSSVLAAVGELFAFGSAYEFFKLAWYGKLGVFRVKRKDLTMEIEKSKDVKETHR